MIRPPVQRGLAAALALAPALILAGCNTPGDVSLSSFGQKMSDLKTPAAVSYYADDQVLPAAAKAYEGGDYGLSTKLYERAVAVTPKDADAWLGLAASYDQLRQFGAADKAYGKLGALIGNRPEYYNNLGYSQLLRGNLVKARDDFLKAYELAPTNPTIVNNIELLRDSVKTTKRG